jgi:AcrR family transcriptional regulator
MAARRQPLETKRRKPRQARATETVAAIVEAAAQILEKGGLSGFTTNAVAERAGVSIGTLYQYFADKNALLMALAREEMEKALGEVARALQGEIDPTVEGRIRAMVRAIVHAFRGRQRARKAVIQAILSQEGGIALMAPSPAAASRTRSCG